MTYQYEKVLGDGVSACTNEEWIRSLPRHELAELLIRTREDVEYDYDYDDQLYECGFHTVWITSDGTEYVEAPEDAIMHEIAWLASPKRENVEVKE